MANLEQFNQIPQNFYGDLDDIYTGLEEENDGPVGFMKDYRGTLVPDMLPYDGWAAEMKTDPNYPHENMANG